VTGPAILSVASGLLAGVLGSTFWSWLIPAAGDSGRRWLFWVRDAHVAPWSWLFWVRNAGLAGWTPANLGGIVFCLAGTLLIGWAVGITRRRTRAVLAIVALIAWFGLTGWVLDGSSIGSLGWRGQGTVERLAT
jgi:hypothetical protein